MVELRGLHKLFPGVRALSDVSFAVRAGSIHALVGENGAGKSTLINILSGTLQPDAGTILLDGKPITLADARSARRQGIVTVHQEVDLFADLSVAENLGHEQALPTTALGRIRWKKLRAQTQAAFAAIGVEMAPTVPAGRLTPAQRQLVEIAAAVSQQARVLILDEPTSSLSGAETQILVEQLRRFRAQGTAILYVSHRLEEIFAVADEVTVLRNGRHVATQPIRETTPAELVRLMVGQKGEADESGEFAGPARAQAARQPGRVRLACRQLRAADGSFADVSLEVRAGEILGLYGLVGAGRSEWAQAVFGLRRVESGSIAVDGEGIAPDGPGTMIRRGLVYLPEDRLRQGLCRSLSVRANTVLASLRRLGLWLWVPRGREVRQTSATVASLGVRLRDIEQPVGTLSGGNQQKVVLGRWLGCEPGVLLLDEPTRGVDVGAKREIHGIVHGLAREGRAVVLISSDLPEVLSQSDRVGVFREGRLVEVFEARTVSAADVTAAAIPAGKHERAGPSATAPVQSRARTGSNQRSTGLLDRLRQGGLLLVVLILLAFQPGSWAAIAQDAALLSFCALGAAVVIVAGGIDISIGALMALSTGLAGQWWEHGQPWLVVVAIGVAVGLAGSLLNAGLSLLGRVHPIVITLGTMSVYRGLTLWRVREDVQVPLAARADLYAMVPWLGLAAAVALALFLGYTVWGRWLYAFGSNPAAAHRVGISQTRVWLLAFGLQGVLVGLAGVLSLATSGSMQPTAFEDVPLQAIAAAVVGGVAITGGRASVPGVLLGCLFLTILPGFCLALHIPTVWQQTLVGSIIAIAVTADVLLRRGEA